MKMGWTTGKALPGCYARPLVWRRGEAHSLERYGRLPVEGLALAMQGVLDGTQHLLGSQRREPPPEL